ncbi:MAG: ATP-binding protein [Deltaproteobacteria bacterium]
MGLKSINEWPPKYRFLLISILFAVIFLIDTRTSAGFVTYAMYIITLIVFTPPRILELIAFSSMATVLILAGFLLQPPGAPPIYGIVNRSIILITLWGGPLLLQRRLRVQVRLLEAGNRLRTILETLPVGVLIVEAADESFSFVNKRARELWGMDVQGRTLADNAAMLNPKRLNGSPLGKHDLPAYKALRGEAIFNEELEVQRSGGTYYVTANAAPINDARGRTVAAVVIFDDITERKIEEDRVKDSENRLRTVLTTIPAPVFIVEARDHRISYMNDRAKELFGFDAFGMNRDEFWAKVKPSTPAGSPYMRDELPSALALRGFEAINKEVAIVDQEGRKYYLIASSAPIHDAQGMVTAALVILEDLTKRKEAEEVLKRDKKTLDLLVIDRSHALLEAQKEIDRSRRLSDLGQLAATIAHELRNPLTAIGLADANIRRKAGNPVIERSADNIQKKLDESNEIIDNLLLYARLKAPRKGTVAICDIIDETTQAARNKFSGRDIQFNITYDEMKGISIPGDPIQLKEVFGNLINNAIEAVPETKKGMIDIALSRENGNTIIRISDNGVGISPENLKKLFQPFFTTKPHGTGLGLSVVNKIIEGHEGSVGFESEVGKGTTVTVALPLNPQ